MEVAENSNILNVEMIRVAGGYWGRCQCRGGGGDK